MYFSGGLAHQGVGVIIGNIFHSKLRDISFHAYSPRICVLKCSLGMLKLELFAVYFPTSWDDILEAEGLYTLLQVLLDNCVSRAAYPILGGDFNACVGPVSRSDDVDLVGCFGFGERNSWSRRLGRKPGTPSRAARAHCPRSPPSHTRIPTTPPQPNQGQPPSSSG